MALSTTQRTALEHETSRALSDHAFIDEWKFAPTSIAAQRLCVKRFEAATFGFDGQEIGDLGYIMHLKIEAVCKAFHGQLPDRPRG